jgi:hypothetical protein
MKNDHCVLVLNITSEYADCVSSPIQIEAQEHSSCLHIILLCATDWRRVGLDFWCQKFVPN